MVSIVTESKEATEDALKGIPLADIGTPEDVANTILFLASEESRYITGTEIVIDGGMTAQ